MLVHDCCKIFVTDYLFESFESNWRVVCFFYLIDDYMTHFWYEHFICIILFESSSHLVHLIRSSSSTPISHLLFCGRQSVTLLVNQQQTLTTDSLLLYKNNFLNILFFFFIPIRHVFFVLYSLVCEPTYRLTFKFFFFFFY